jgi:hypothetical protein
MRSATVLGANLLREQGGSPRIGPDVLLSAPMMDIRERMAAERVRLEAGRRRQAAEVEATLARLQADRRRWAAQVEATLRRGHAPQRDPVSHLAEGIATALGDRGHLVAAALVDLGGALWDGRPAKRTLL